MLESNGPSTMTKLVLSIFVALAISVCAAHASQAELQEAYTAYQEAAATGDVRAALPHARRAYELGLELFGPENRNTGLLAFNYGAALNEAGEFGQAIDVLQNSRHALDATEERVSEDRYNTYYELSFAYLAARQGANAAYICEAAIALG